MEEDLNEVLLLPLLLLRSDIGEIQEERPERDEIPESECEWLCLGLGVESFHSWAWFCADEFVGVWLGGVGPDSRLLFHQLEIDFKDRSLLRCKDCCLFSCLADYLFLSVLLPV